MRFQEGKTRAPAVVMAFAGWNDAGDAATNALVHLRDQYEVKSTREIDEDAFWDYQATRPLIRRTADGRRIVWPKVTISTLDLPDQDLILIEGPEPSLMWRKFISLLLAEIRLIEPRVIALLGAMLSDAPHSRPLPLSGTTSSEELAALLNFEPNSYEGPIGIVGAIADTFTELNLPVVSLWAAVPHYAANPPSPKATLVLLNALQTVIGSAIEMGDLEQEAEDWVEKINQLAEDDSEISEYIQTLEDLSDKVEEAEGAGDEIAAAFEKYLQEHDDDQQP